MSRSADADRRVVRTALRQSSGNPVSAAAELGRQSHHHARAAHAAWTKRRLQHATDEYWAARRRLRAAAALERNRLELHAIPPLRTRTPS